MNGSLYLHLSRRESQIMDVLYHAGEASVAYVVERMPDRPGYNTVRNIMAVPERKGYLRHRQEGQRYLYTPVDNADSAKRSAVAHLVDTFFAGSRPRAVQAILGTEDSRPSPAELDEIALLIEESRARD